MERKHIALDLAELKFDSAGDFTGNASVFGNEDSYGDTIHPGAFFDAVGAGREVKMYFNHGWKTGQLPVGKMFVFEDSKGLRVERAEFTKGMTLAEDVKTAAQNGTLTGLSIGYVIASDGFKKKSGTAGRDIYRIKTLKEVSVVDFPADEYAQMDIKSAIEEADSLKELEAMLRDAAGFSRADACALVSRVKSLAHGERAAESQTSVATVAASLMLHAHALKMR